MSSCLFCATLCPSKFTFVDGQVKRLKRENDPRNPTSPLSSTLGFGREDSVIAEQLKVVFILRNILKLKQDKLCEFLGSSGQLHPEYWISVCLSCEKTVGLFYQTVKDIARLQKKVLGFSNELKRKIRKSKNEEGRGAAGGLWAEIRNEVLIDTKDVSVSEGEQIISAPPTTSSESEYDPKEDFQDSYRNDDDVEEDYVPNSKRNIRKEFTSIAKNVIASTSTSPKPSMSIPNITGNECFSFHYKCPDCNALLPTVEEYTEHELLHKNGNGQVCKMCFWLCESLETHENYWHSHTFYVTPRKEIKIIEIRKEKGSLEDVVVAKRELNVNLVEGDDDEEEYRASYNSSLSNTELQNYSLFLDPEDEDHDPPIEQEQTSSDAKQTCNQDHYKSIITRFDDSDPLCTRFIRGNIRRYGCRQCPAEENSLKYLLIHMKLHEGDSGAIPCPECGWFVMPNKLQRHNGIHHEHLRKRSFAQSQKPPNRFYYQCPECNALVCQLARYREHEEMHENGAGRICEEEGCGWLVKEIGRHRKRWHPEDEKSARRKVKHPRRIKVMEKRSTYLHKYSSS